MLTKEIQQHVESQANSSIAEVDSSCLYNANNDIIPPSDHGFSQPVSRTGSTPLAANYYSHKD